MGREILCAYKDVRRFMELYGLVFYARPHRAAQEMCTMIESMEPRKLLTFGYVRTQDNWT